MAERVAVEGRIETAYQMTPPSVGDTLCVDAACV